MKNLLLALLVLVMPACAATNTIRIIDFLPASSFTSNDWLAAWSVTRSNTVKVAGSTMAEFMVPVVSNYVKTATNGLGTTVNTNVLATTNALTVATNNVVTNLVAYTKTATNTLDVALRAVITNALTASSDVAAATNATLPYVTNLVNATTNFATVNINQLVLTNALGVTVGGTGTNTITAGRLLAGNGTNPVTEVTISTGLLLAGGVLTATNSSGTATVTNTAVGSFTVSNRFQNLYQTLAYVDATNVPVDLSTGNNFRLSVTNNFYLTFTNVADGQSGNILFVQDTQGASNEVHTSFTYNPMNVFTNGSLALSTTNASGMDRWKFDSYGTNVFVYALTNWQPRSILVAETKTNAALTCTLLGSCTVSNDWYDFGPGVAQADQFIKVTPGMEACQVDLYLYGNGTSQSVYVQFRTAANALGSVVGTDSIAVTVTNWGWYTFTWASNPTLTSDCYLHPVSDGQTRWNVALSNQYEDTTYSYYYNGTAAPNADWMFKIYTNQ